mmetsp:Transcript_76778/g.213362  ORF Transcript_76778/g.213362 Transcript_76778/m.213362 type:complete len:231 (-) Transcript_76778:450-1142(-)
MASRSMTDVGTCLMLGRVAQRLARRTASSTLGLPRTRRARWSQSSWGTTRARSNFLGPGQNATCSRATGSTPLRRSPTPTQAMWPILAIGRSTSAASHAHAKAAPPQLSLPSKPPVLGQAVSHPTRCSVMPAHMPSSLTSARMAPRGAGRTIAKILTSSTPTTMGSAPALAHSSTIARIGLSASRRARKSVSSGSPTRAARQLRVGLPLRKLAALRPSQPVSLPRRRRLH